MLLVGVLKELGKWAAANPDDIPQHLRHAIQPFHADVPDNSLSQPGPSELHSIRGILVKVH